MRFRALVLVFAACRDEEPSTAPAPTPTVRDARLAVAHDDATDFAALDAIFGGEGLIRGFDPAKVIGRSPATLKEALPRSFTIDSVCDDDACAGEAPPPPGGKTRLRVGMLRRGAGDVGVSFDLHGPQLLHLYSLLESSLGLSEIVDKKTRIYKHDSLRYEVHADPYTWAVTVKIEKI
jgi:hypothetical protein